MTEDKPLNVTVPEHQRDIYDEEAEQMGFDSRSAYIRAMINAGRREFGLDPEGEGRQDTTLHDLIEERVIQTIADTDGAGREEVVDAVAGEIDATVTESLERLDAEGVIDYSVQEDGFVVRGRGD